MPRQKGVFKVEGTMDDITFFKRKDVFLVRTKGGVSKERIMTDPAFLRTRENNSEFGNVAHSGKMLRSSCTVLINSAYDGLLTTRMMRVLTKVKNLDTVSARGAREVAVGIQTDEGKNELKSFDMNSRAALSSILFAPVVLDKTTGMVSITGLVPIDMLRFPTHATHVSFKSGFLNLDLETGIYDISYSPVSNLPLSAVSSNVSLTPAAVPTGVGLSYYFLLVEFFQEINGLQYALNDGGFNALNLLEVS